MRADGEMGEMGETISPITAVTRGPRHHFFGYYERCPWDRTGRFLLAMEVDFQDRLPGPEDTATVGLIDRQDGDRFHPLAETHTWNFQQGAMVQWVPPASDHVIIFNNRRHDKLMAMLLDIRTGERWELPRPIYTVSPDGQWALGIDFARLSRMRPGYGYALPIGVEEPTSDRDGIFGTDLKTGVSRLILSMDQLLAFRPNSSMQGATHWIEHLLVNPDSSRFLFLHRFSTPGQGIGTRLLTANPDGSDLYCLAEGMVSHYCWRNAQHVLAWVQTRSTGSASYARALANRGAFKIVKNWIKRRQGARVRQRLSGDRFVVFTDRTQERSDLGVGILAEDAHIGFSPDGRWLLGDTYPDGDQKQSLYLYDDQAEKLITLGRFYAPSELTGDVRCDLHARWSRDGRQVCIDSPHAGTRQMYVVDVSSVVG